MGKHRKVLVTILVGLAFVALVAYRRNPAEPSYGGHPLSYWVQGMGARDILEAEQYDKTKNAIDHIGVAALPFLVRWLQYEPPEWRSRLSGWFSRTDFPLAGQLSDLIIQPRALQLAVGTPSAFQILGKRAAPALDDLCRLMNDTNSPYTANQAAETLASLGTNALPALLAVATNAQHPARGEALAAIGAIDDLGDTARLAVPVLTN